MLDTIIREGQYTVDQVDLEGLQRVQKDLLDIEPYGNSGRFHGIIDQRMTLDDQIATIAAPYRIQVFRRAASIFFERLKAGLPPRTLFNARNKTESEQRSLIFADNDQPDGVILTYLNAMNGWSEESVQYPADKNLVNPQSDTVIGLTTEEAVKSMARYIYDRGKYEKDLLSVTTMEEGALLGPHDVFAITNALKEDPPVEGEIIAAQGNVYTFDQTIPAGTYLGRVRTPDGTTVVSSNMTILTDSDTQSIAQWGALTVPDGARFGTGLLYSFHTVSHENADLYYATSVQPTRDGPVTIEAVRYDERVFACDFEGGGAMAGRSIKHVDRGSVLDSLPAARIISNLQPSIEGSVYSAMSEEERTFTDGRDPSTSEAATGNKRRVGLERPDPS